MPAKPAPQARVPRSLSVGADLDAAWSAALDARGESRPQWIARHVQEDQAGTVKALIEALEAIDKGYNDGGKLSREGMQEIARAALAPLKEE